MLGVCYIFSGLLTAITGNSVTKIFITKTQTKHEPKIDQQMNNCLDATLPLLDHWSGMISESFEEH